MTYVVGGVASSILRRQPPFFFGQVSMKISFQVPPDQLCLCSRYLLFRRPVAQLHSEYVSQEQGGEQGQFRLSVAYAQIAGESVHGLLT